MNSLQITITGRALDGLVVGCNESNEGRTGEYRTVEKYVLDQVDAMGRRLADMRQIGVIPSSDFILRFEPAEFAAIVALAATDQAAAGLLARLRGTPVVHADSEELLQGLQYLAAQGAIQADRIPDLTSYERPVYREQP